MKEPAMNTIISMLAKLRLENKIVFVLILFWSCSRYDSSDLLPVYSCAESSCESVIYNIEISRWNLKNIVEKNVDERGVFHHCLNINEFCGASIFRELNQLYNRDTVFYSFLKDKYDIEEHKSFNNNLSTNFTNYGDALDDLSTNLIEKCACD